jgi:hypothetical protein
MKFVLTCQHDEYGPKITYEFSNVFLPDVLDNLQNFLKGCGFVFDGVLDIVEEDDVKVQVPHELKEEDDILYKPVGEDPRALNQNYRNEDVDIDGRC